MMDLKYWTMRLTTAENGFRFSQGLRAAEEDEVIEGVNRVLLIASRETTGAVIAQFSVAGVALETTLFRACHLKLL
jgi:hypothetical protein